jgi:hypothetical protein
MLCRKGVSAEVCVTPSGLLLLIEILGILSGCCSSRDLARFARWHHQAFGVALDLELLKASCDSTFLYLFEPVVLEELFGLLREWMLAQIADQNKDVDQRICDNKTLSGSAVSHMAPMVLSALSPRSRSMHGSRKWQSRRPRSIPATPTSARL